MILAALLWGLSSPAGTSADAPSVSVSVGSTPQGRVMHSGFVGVSLETKALHIYTGRDPRAINPVLVALLRGLAPRQAPVLRIGGDSTDYTWWPMRGVIPPPGISYALTKGWMRTTHALARDIRGKLIVGVNLAGDRPNLAAVEGRALVRGLGRQYIQALEVGNEPDLYGTFPWYRDRAGHVARARPRSYDVSSFLSEFSHWHAVLPRLPLVGPSTAGLAWMRQLPRFLRVERSVRIATLHRYPLRGCTGNPASPSYASIPNLLADSSAAGLAAGVAPYPPVAHARDLTFRLDEMNSASCSGKFGVSDTFASTLWALDTLFNLQRAGVDGVNFHSLPNAGYELFTFSRTTGGGWQAFVHPDYYALLLFAQAFPPGARRIPVSAPPGPVKIWAVRTAGGREHVVLINKDPGSPVTVKLSIPGATQPASLERLQAPTVSSTNGVTLGGRGFGDETTTGVLLGPPQTETLVPVLGSYSVTLPAASIAMLTPAASSGGGGLARRR